MFSKRAGLIAVTLGGAFMGRIVGASPASDDIAGIVKMVMDDTYSAGYDARHACWVYRWKDEKGGQADYCMRPGPPHVVTELGGEMLFLNTFSVTDIRDDERFSYSHNQPGLMGAFKVRLDGRQAWTYEAMDAGTDYGTAGDCGCAEPRFVKLSNAGDYGWQFVSGGTWQGITVSDFSIVTPLNGRMQDISRIPRSLDQAPGMTYAISVKEEPATKGFFALQVLKETVGKPPETFPVPFDVAKRLYVLPAGR